MGKLVRFIIMISFISMVVACSNQSEELNDEETLMVSAASSLSPVMEEVTNAFVKDYPDITVNYNYGGSGKLAQQIQQGAPVDLFLSADQNWMEVLVEQQLVDSDSIASFASNQLIVISQKGSEFNLDELLDIPSLPVEQIAIGNPESVPAGKYAKEALQRENVWDELESQFVYGKDVRQVLTFVESGNTDIGFIYASDLETSQSVETLFTIPEGLHEEIYYPAGVISTSNQKDEALSFIHFLQSNEAQTIFAQYYLQQKE
ncbi:molybdate ABC transporter substrate-binding protein [Oceanobacillus halotolerans]|uniref:molybdate ABC transporter substrate-binding protein n=1 Tax=Oceanobacillus halotolerans TaxID=2663380 RepID=UPI0013D5910D|nr:molybdate ABC transporter substrate-binding protein [Oceanobacillus halotolerans]